MYPCQVALMKTFICFCFLLLPITVRWKHFFYKQYNPFI